MSSNTAICASVSAKLCIKSGEAKSQINLQYAVHLINYQGLAISLYNCAHLGGVGITATVTGSVTRDRRSESSPGIGGETIVNEISPDAVPLYWEPDERT